MRQVFAVQLCEPSAQTWMHVVIPVGQHEQQWVMSTAARKMVQELQARLIAPMEILDCEQNRLFGGQTGEEVGERHETSAFFLLWIARPRRCGMCQDPLDRFVPLFWCIRCAHSAGRLL